MAKGKKEKGKKKGADTQAADASATYELVTDPLETDGDEWTWESYSEEELPLDKKDEKLSPAKQKELEKKLEQQRKEAELAAELAAEAERIRHAEEKQATIAKTIIDTGEQEIRVKQLSRTLKRLCRIKKYNRAIAYQERLLSEWDQYLRCDGLPAPFNSGELTVYLYNWENSLEVISAETLIDRGKEVLYLLRNINDVILVPAGLGARQYNNLLEARQNFRNFLNYHCDLFVYCLLRAISDNFEQVGTTCQYKLMAVFTEISVWLQAPAVQTGGGFDAPAAQPMFAFMRRRTTVGRTFLDFSDMGITVHLPVNMTCFDKAVKMFHANFDHLSDLCATSRRPEIPAELQMDLFRNTWLEWNDKLWYKFDNRYKPKNEPPMVVDRDAGIIPEVPYKRLEPTADDYVLIMEDQLYASIVEKFTINEPETNINLRKYLIMGGTFYLELVYQPPQPVAIPAFAMSINRLELPTMLTYVPFHQDFNPPPPADPATLKRQEDVEEERKRQDAELYKLLQITISVPNSIMLFESPLMCVWNDSEQLWTTNDIYDVKYLEEKMQIQFRSGVFGKFGVAVYRYINLPFQGWEMRPEEDETVTLQISGAILLVEFNVKCETVCLSQVQNVPNDALQNIIGVYMKLPLLIEKMQQCGADFFPDFDAFCYVKGVNQKQWPMEKHLYMNMALMSLCYNFCWSRWNLAQERRKIVMQMREYKQGKLRQENYKMTAVSPLKAYFVECSEAYPTFEDVPVEDTVFSCDLYYLMRMNADVETKIKIRKTDPILVETVTNLLLATRILTYS